MLQRARGCLMGQLAGDALGGQVEFCSPEQIRRCYPEGVREMQDGGTWNTLAGQPTDDSEMALALARSLVEVGSYKEKIVRAAYLRWINSGPFDCGMTIRAGLNGSPNAESQANGALMRVSPLGIFGARRNLAEVAEWAQLDALITHPHPICQHVNALFAMAIASAVREACTAEKLYQQILLWAEQMGVAPMLMAATLAAQDSPPADFVHHQGWVLIAWQNALFQLLHAPNVADALPATISFGGDTDTNAAITGALLGAVCGVESLPAGWQSSILQCKPSPDRPDAAHPRPVEYWPVDAYEIAEYLLGPPP